MTSRVDDLKAIESHFYCPEGKQGIFLAQSMGVSNTLMINNSIDILEINNSESVLELGFACCTHLDYLMSKADNISYYGLEISDTMLLEATNINKLQIETEKVNFGLYDGDNIPFGDSCFDKIFSVNTIYFWQDALSFLNELSRVMKPNGVLLITYIDRGFMQSLPFVGDKFCLYDDDSIKNLISLSGFDILNIENVNETIFTKSGDSIERKYSLVSLVKARE